MTLRTVALVLSLVLRPAQDVGRIPGEVRICPSLSEAVGPGRGPILVVFFSADCSHCYEDLFEARYAVGKGGWPVSVVGVSSGPLNELRTFLEKHAWFHPVVHDRKRTLFRKFKVEIVPFKVLLVEGETVYKDDPYECYDKRWEDLKKCLAKICSR